MTSKQRIIAVWRGDTGDHVPLTTWCFGFPAPPQLRWKRDGREVSFWYSRRMHHLHTIPGGWTLEDDFKRVLAWQSLGVDDVIDVSVPWSTDPDVSWTDRTEAGAKHPVITREYRTPAGALTHRIEKTEEHLQDGWVVQPDHVPLFEDFNIPRAVEHAVSSPGDAERIPYLYCPPRNEEERWFAAQMEDVNHFAEDHGVAVQAWSAFGMDAVVWLTGVEGAVMLAMDQPEAFARLVDTVAATDRERTELAARHEGVDMIVQRGWYSSTDFWSPRLFEEHVFSRVAELAAIAHRHGKLFGYVMTTGVEILGPRLAEAGVDALYFIDPVQDTVSLERARDLLSGKMTLVGGINATSLVTGDVRRIEGEVKRAIEILGPTGRFILHPVDALFPDTGWDSVDAMLRVWERHRTAVR